MNIYGNKVVLRAIELEDMEMMRELMNNPHIEHMVCGWSYPISKVEQLKWFENVNNNSRNFRFIIEMIDTHEAVGLVSLYDIDWKNRSASHGIKLCDKAPKGCGIGTDSVMALMRYAFDELQMVRLNGAWVEYNIPSISLYKKCGWSIEGKKKKAKYYDGNYYDVLIGGILKEDYIAIRKELKWDPYRFD